MHSRLSSLLSITLAGTLTGALTGTLAGTLVVSLAGCSQEDTYQSNCPDNVCGVNSAETTRLPIAELHIAPGENTGEISRLASQVVGFIGPDGSSEYLLSVENGQFVAVRGAETLTGQALLGARILVANHNDDSMTELQFNRHETAPTWTQPTTLIDRYAFSFYAPDQGTLEPICLAADGDIESPYAWAVAVSGERYERQTNEVLETDSDALGWFSIACSGSALFKMKHMGYEARPADPLTNTTTPTQRQATLKMLTADYCSGASEEFTRDGTPLHWQNSAGWSQNDSQYGGSLEAYWGPEGALCLDTPRLGTRELQRIEEECGGPLPSCDGFEGAYEWRTESPGA